jgi:hypothetical protein
MARMEWDYRRVNIMETQGVSRGVFYSSSGKVEAWNGLISVEEDVPDIRSLVTYADGVKKVQMSKQNNYAATIEAYSYPTELDEKYARPFGFSYRAETNRGYQLHIVYNALAQVSSLSYFQDEGSAFTIDITTRPVPVENKFPSAHLYIDSWTVDYRAMPKIEDILYGTTNIDPRLPMPQELIELLEEYAPLRVTRIDDGEDDSVYLISGPSTQIENLGNGEWAITGDYITFGTDAGGATVTIGDY